MVSDEQMVTDEGGIKSLSKSSRVSCSICLEVVTDNGDRSLAKLQCGHEFHLDCIGSAFNIKGAMQCPNCRKIEKGQWLFAAGRSFQDTSFEDWPHDEDLYDLSYSEMSFGVQWCPVTPFPRLPSSFDEGEFPSTPYHDLWGQHAVFAEHTSVPSSNHPCPYVAYYGPIHSSSSSPVGSMSDGSNYSSHWGGPSGSNEMATPFSFAPMDPHYQSWDHHALPFSAASSRLVAPDQSSVQAMIQRLSRPNSDLARAGSFIHPFVVSHSLGPRLASSPPASMIPSYQGSAARARDRAQALQAYFQPPNPSPPMRVASSRRSNSHPRSPHVGTHPSSSDQAGGFHMFPSSRNIPEVENPTNSRFYSWERDHLANFPPLERDSSWGGWAGSSSFRQRH